MSNFVDDLCLRLERDRVCALVGLPGPTKKQWVHEVRDRWRGPVWTSPSPVEAGKKLSDGSGWSLISIEDPTVRWEDVRALLERAEDSVVLVAIERLAGWPLAYLAPIPSLPPDDAKALLESSAGPNDANDQLAELARRVDHQPDLVRSVAQVLGTTEANRLLASGAGLLEVLTLGFDNARDRLQDAFAAMTAESRQLVHWLVWAETAVDFQVLGELTNLAPPDVERRLAALGAGGWVRSSRGAATASAVARMLLHDSTATSEEASRARALDAVCANAVARLEASEPGATRPVAALARIVARSTRNRNALPGQYAAALLAWAIWLGQREHRDIEASAIEFNPWCVLPSTSTERSRAVAAALANGSAATVPVTLWLANHDVLERPNVDTNDRIRSAIAATAGGDAWLQARTLATAARIAFRSGSRAKMALYTNQLDALQLEDLPRAARFGVELDRAWLQLALGFPEKARSASGRTRAMADDATASAVFQLEHIDFWALLLIGDLRAAREACARGFAAARLSGEVELLAAAEAMATLIAAFEGGVPEIASAGSFSFAEEILPDFVELAVVLEFIANRRHPDATTEFQAGGFDRILDATATSGLPTILTVEFARLLAAGDPAALDDWLRRYAKGGGHRPLETACVLPAARLLWSRFATEASLSPGHHAGRVVSTGLSAHPHGYWYRLGHGEPVDLLKRRPLRRIFRHLLEMRIRRPGVGTDVDQMIEIGWPGEAMAESSGRARVYATIKQLRDLGLEPILLTGDDGYMFDPELVVHMRDLTVDSARRLSEATPVA